MNKTILKIAIGLLSRREHSEKEIFQKLALRDYEADEVQPVVDHLVSRDYLSNERFADSIFRTRVNKGYGWRYIQNELSQKGVNDEIINQIAKNSEIDWYLQAELAYNKRFDEMACDDQKEKTKRIRFLQYRGFSSDEIMTAIKAQ